MSSLTKIGIVVLVAIAAVAVVIAKRSPAVRSTPTQGTGGACCADIASATPAGAAATQPVQVALPRLLDLGAGKCIPCKKMAPILEELRAELAGKLQVDFVDVWQNPDAGQTYGIRLIPTQIFFDDKGKELARHEGFMSKEDILAQWSALGVSLAGPKTD